MKCRLVAFDLDGTLTYEDNFWGRIHERFGCLREAEKLREEYERARNYRKWFDDTLLLWTGRKYSEIEEIVDTTTLMPGARETCEELRNAGALLAIISSGLAPLANHVAGNLGIDFVFSNDFAVKDGRLTGHGTCKVGLENKDEVLRQVAEEQKIPLNECAAVGDHRNDISMLKAAGLGISFGSSIPELDESADVVIKRKDLREILGYLK